MNASPCLLDPGFDLTLRPMRYPRFYEMYRDAIRNTWSVEEGAHWQASQDSGFSSEQAIASASVALRATVVFVMAVAGRDLR